MDKLTKERIEQIIANIDSDEARGATQSYVSYKVLRELCELALQGMGGEAVAEMFITSHVSPFATVKLLCNQQDVPTGTKFYTAPAASEQKDSRIEKWNHGCNILAMNVWLWTPSCPSCGMPHDDPEAVRVTKLMLGNKSAASSHGDLAKRLLDCADDPERSPKDTCRLLREAAGALGDKK
jgi:hypothetical protein